MASSTASISATTDPLERRRLWREWIECDTPGEPLAVRRVVAKPQAIDAANAWINEAVPHSPAIVAGLRSAIDESIVNGQLSLSDRQRLMRRSMQLGLSRFEASLLIAAVLHRNEPSPSPRRVTHVRRIRVVRWTIGRIVIVALIAEVFAMAGAAAFFK